MDDFCNHSVYREDRGIPSLSWYLLVVQPCGGFQVLQSVGMYWYVMLLPVFHCLLSAWINIDDCPAHFCRNQISLFTDIEQRNGASHGEATWANLLYLCITKFRRSLFISKLAYTHIYVDSLASEGLILFCTFIFMPERTDATVRVS